MEKRNIVQLFDSEGNATSTKERNKIDKSKDLCFSVHVLVFTPSKEIVLAQIPVKTNYPEIDAGKIKSTATSLLRVEETPQQAAKRAIKEELSLTEATPLLLGRHFHEFQNDMKRWVDVYYLINQENSVSFKDENTNQLLYFNRLNLTEKISNERDSFTLTFQFIWDTYKEQFPF